jgi:hypothetical protein
MYYNELSILPTAFRTEVHTQNIKCSEGFILKGERLLGFVCCYMFYHVLKFIKKCYKYKRILITWGIKIL